MEYVVVDAARRMSEAGLPLTGDLKRSRFRIYRDTRFSNDKRPYKTHTSAVFTGTGDEKDHGFADYRDDALADHLRRQNLLVRRPLDPELLATPALTDAVVEMAHDSLPLLEYVW